MAGNPERPANGAAEIVQSQLALLAARRVQEEVCRIELVVAGKFEEVAVKGLGA